MRRLILAGFLALALPAGAQELQPQDLTLKVTIEDAMLIAQTLGAIQCGTVTQLAVCQRAAALLRAIQEQAKAHAK